MRLPKENEIVCVCADILIVIDSKLTPNPTVETGYSNSHGPTLRPFQVRKYQTRLLITYSETSEDDERLLCIIRSLSLRF